MPPEATKQKRQQKRQTVLAHLRQRIERLAGHPRLLIEQHQIERTQHQRRRQRQRLEALFSSPGTVSQRQRQQQHNQTLRKHQQPQAQAAFRIDRARQAQQPRCQQSAIQQGNRTLRTHGHIRRTPQAEQTPQGIYAAQDIEQAAPGQRGQWQHHRQQPAPAPECRTQTIMYQRQCHPDSSRRVNAASTCATLIAAMPC